MTGALRLMQASQGGVRAMGWLELEAAQSGKGQHPEAVVVLTFLALLAESEIRDALEQGASIMAVLRTSLLRLCALWGGCPTSAWRGPAMTSLSR